MVHGHVWMWELDYKESWALKHWCFGTVVLEKTLESPLESKEIKPVNTKWNQFWIFIGRTDAEAETPILRPPDTKNRLIGKTLMLGNIEAGRRRGWQRMRWLDGITNLVDMSLFEFRGLVMDREAWRAAVHGVTKSNWATVLNWTEVHSAWSCGFCIIIFQLILNVNLQSIIQCVASFYWCSDLEQFFLIWFIIIIIIIIWLCLVFIAAQAFLSLQWTGGLSTVLAVYLIVVTSLVVENGLYTCVGFSSHGFPGLEHGCGPQALLYHSMWDCLRSGIKLMPPALAVILFTTEP